MSTRLERHQLANKILEFSIMQHLDTDYDDHQYDWHNAFSGQGKMLLTLSQEDNISQKELATRLDLTPQSTAELVKKLEKKKLITKVKSENDGRIFLISLTSLGKERINKIDTSVPDYLSYLTDEEQQQYGVLLTKMTDGLRDKIKNQDTTFHNGIHKLLLHEVDKRLNNNK